MRLGEFQGHGSWNQNPLRSFSLANSGPSSHFPSAAFTASALGDFPFLKILEVKFWSTTVCHLHVIVIIGFFYVKSSPLSSLFNINIVISCLAAQGLGIVSVTDRPQDPKRDRDILVNLAHTPLLHSAPVDPRCPHSQTSFSLPQGCDSLPFTFPFFFCMNRRSWDGIVVEKKISKRSAERTSTVSALSPKHIPDNATRVLHKDLLEPHLESLPIGARRETCLLRF